MAEENVPKKVFDENNIGNMLIDRENKSNNEIIEKKSNKKENHQLNECNSIDSVTFPSSIKVKLKHKNSIKLKGDCSNYVKFKIKNSLSLRNSLKTQRYKNKSEFDDIKKLSINKKNSQSHERLNEALKEQMKTKENNKDLNEMNIENDNINNNVNENINSINNEINLEFIKIKNNMKEIVHSPLTLMTYEEFNVNLVPYEYINDIWNSFIEKEKYNNYSFDSIISIQTDIKDSMRCILIDWIISLQNKFFRKSNTLFLTINLIDRYLSKRS